MTKRIEEEHVVHVRFNDPRDRMHGIKKNYSVKLRVSKAVSKAHAESKVALHMRKSGYVITSMKTTRRRKRLKEGIDEHLGSNATTAEFIHDFVNSKNPKFAGKSKKERIRMALGAYYGRNEEMDFDEAVAGMDHANRVYADNTSGGSTIWSDGSNKAHRPFSGNKTGKPANSNRRIYLVRKIKETLEMDDPATADRARKTKVLSKIVDLKAPTDYLGNTPDERAIRKWYADNTLKHPDRAGNGDDVFSATGLKRASGRFNPDDNVQRYIAANEESLDELSKGKLWKYVVKADPQTNVNHKNTDAEHARAMRRERGITRANGKIYTPKGTRLYANVPATEETDLDELSIKTLGDYRYKANHEIDNAARTRLPQNKFINRAKGVNLAALKIVDKIISKKP